MYGYVKGARDVLHTIMLKHCLADFQKVYELGEDFNINSQLTIFNRMQNEYVEALKTDWPETALDKEYYHNALYLLFRAYVEAAKNTMPSLDDDTIKRLFKQQFKLKDSFNFNSLIKNI